MALRIANLQPPIHKAGHFSRIDGVVQEAKVRIQQVMAWQPGGAHFGSEGGRVGGATAQVPVGSRKTSWRARVSAGVESMIWMFQRSEGVGWLIALLVNIATVGWLGVALWSALFCVAILLETMAEPVQPAD